ncbi:hypothetical protein GUITHDRAFT_156261 [Guillardia theta CCMP2712]|uniref:Uncharacterized protein n=1 Tax=Guillardia theta (strain CCMP2712) TaxID=905079 RepID=L1I8V6_GUITC|nr:hypothetical protein GUITHDRAFT_156261 [Guillardia theta CCMP2712]EKX32668.1 hypothetical protein GUITHDRAFT_156261 [Guillardia theta CCMP2712]|eukprot:XP_005819648.1 hypothetical protein GUITHDRAFT_156261 [Guillardia theta CCMP2712]
MDPDTPSLPRRSRPRPQLGGRCGPAALYISELLALTRSRGIADERTRGREDERTGGREDETTRRRDDQTTRRRGSHEASAAVGMPKDRRRSLRG